MRKCVLGFVVCSGLLLTGCTGFWRSRHESSAKMCADWRYIGIKSESMPACPPPAADGWEAEPLFGLREKAREPNPYDQRQQAPASQGPGTAAAQASVALDRFCVYQTTETTGKPRKPPFESAAAAGLERLDRDCAVISTSAIGLSDPQLAAMADHFLSQAGKPAALNVHNERGVRLAFLDTQPTAEEVPRTLATSLHGYTLALIARHLVCGGGALDRCAAQITTQLALPMRKFDPTSKSLTDIDTVRGGVIGTQGDLAKAIVAEVDAWQDDVTEGRADPQQHLVLNVSLGWDPRQVDGLGEKPLADLKAGTQAVYEALEEASRAGVLVLAAAGNRKSCSSATGPLLPAAWEDEPPAEGTSRESRLVYAVGGVGSDSQPLDNALPRSMPPRIACGENAVVPVGDHPHTSWLYTGSSVATAVVSSTAAVVWDTRPDLSPAAVMNLVTESGDEMGFDADFGFGGGAAPRSRRVSLCAAVRHACDQTGFTGVCPVPEECPAWRAEDTDVADWVIQPLSGTCHWWVVPQPDDPPCPPCDPPDRW